MKVEKIDYVAELRRISALIYRDQPTNGYDAIVLREAANLLEFLEKSTNTPRNGSEKGAP